MKLAEQFAHSSDGAASSQGARLETKHGDVERVSEVSPETQALNDAQDERLAKQAETSERNYRARQELESELTRRYGLSIRQLDAEISELSDVLKSTGAIRVGLMKLTGKISQDPQRDLHTLRATREMYEGYQNEARETLEERLREEKDFTNDAPTETRIPDKEMQMEERDQSTHAVENHEASSEEERIKFLEEHRAKPVAEAHLRPGGKTEEFVHSNVAAKHAAEIARLRADLHGTPDYDPDLDLAAGIDQDFDEGLELSW